jgi:hypothetical protein
MAHGGRPACPPSIPALSGWYNTLDITYDMNIMGSDCPNSISI